MIVITGAAGFIGSYLVGYLNQQGLEDLVLVDDFSRKDKESNYISKKYNSLIDREIFFDFLSNKASEIEFIFHLGARTDTTEKDEAIFNKLNLEYSKQVWNFCVEKQCPLVYASSAATYGLGEWGFDDSDAISLKLKPLNPYGDSKQRFDLWVLEQKNHPPFWAGLKFFNVFGPNEYHKGRMASVPFHIFNTLKAGNPVKLFRSHKPGIKDGEQRRDFIYVKDLAKVCLFLFQNRYHSGIYNLGTGQARTFYDLALACFSSLSLEPTIAFIDTPEDLRDTYQYFTQADIRKLRQIGFTEHFTSLEDGILDYYRFYLSVGNYF
jgi:ADP-L-glycero-D-manno-heptose 6-epimerase